MYRLLIACVLLANLWSPAMADESQQGAPNTAGAEAGQQDDTLLIQMRMQNENVIYTSVSNVLKTKHDTAKNAIGNIR